MWRDVAYHEFFLLKLARLCSRHQQVIARQHPLTWHSYKGHGQSDHHHQPRYVGNLTGYQHGLKKEAARRCWLALQQLPTPQVRSLFLQSDQRQSLHYQF